MPREAFAGGEAGQLSRGREYPVAPPKGTCFWDCVLGSVIASGVSSALGEASARIRNDKSASIQRFSNTDATLMERPSHGCDRRRSTEIAFWEMRQGCSRRPASATCRFPGANFRDRRFTGGNEVPRPGRPGEFCATKSVINSNQPGADQSNVEQCTAWKTA
jgi:hypothetical protein